MRESLLAACAWLEVEELEVEELEVEGVEVWPTCVVEGGLVIEEADTVAEADVVADEGVEDEAARPSWVLQSAIKLPTHDITKKYNEKLIKNQDVFFKKMNQAQGA